MKKSLPILSAAAIALALVGAPSTSQAEQFFPTQNFDLAVGNLYQQGSWLGQRTLSATNPPQVIDGNLSYTPGGLPASSGRMVRILDTGQDLSIAFTDGVVTPADGNTYYLSALIQIQDDSPSLGSATGDYILHFSNGVATSTEDGNFTGTGFRGRVFLRNNGDNTAELGINHGIDASGIVWSGVTVGVGETFFLVAKITEIPGDNNDTAEIFVFKNDPVPDTEPGTSAAVSVGNGTAVATNADVAAPIAQGGYGRVGIRQGAAGGSPRPILIDELRAGSTWASVTSDPDPDEPTSARDWTLYN